MRLYWRGNLRLVIVLLGFPPSPLINRNFQFFINFNHNRTWKFLLVCMGFRWEGVETFFCSHACSGLSSLRISTRFLCPDNFESQLIRFKVASLGLFCRHVILTVPVSTSQSLFVFWNKTGSGNLILLLIKLYYKHSISFRTQD